MLIFLAVLATLAWGVTSYSKGTTNVRCSALVAVAAIAAIVLIMIFGG